MTADGPAPIFVVDDDDDARAAVVDLLRFEGYDVVEAQHGREALDMLSSGEHGTPSLIVLDIEMPVMTGREFLAELLKDPSPSRIPVVIVSGSEMPSEARTYGAEYVRKPHDPQSLARIIERLARRHSSRWKAPGSAT